MTHGDQPQSQEGTAPSQPKAASRLVPLQGSDLKRHLYHRNSKMPASYNMETQLFPIISVEFDAKCCYFLFT